MLLSALAFDLEAGQSWTALGLSRLEGDKPTTRSIRSRVQLAIGLLAEHRRLTEQDADKAWASELEVKAARAGEECMSELPDVYRDRRMLRGTSRVPQWYEMPPELLVFLQAKALKTGKAYEMVRGTSEL